VSGLYDIDLTSRRVIGWLMIQRMAQSWPILGVADIAAIKPNAATI
jgi:hypothetical protein